MQPIVDGLEIEYGGIVEFEKVNASTPEGMKIFNNYPLMGHPSYLILDDQGQILWQSVGEQPAENLKDALLSVIEVEAKT